MKKIIVLCGLLIGSANAANDQPDLSKHLESQFNITSDDERIIEIIKRQSRWMWNKETNKLAYCMNIQGRDALCTDVPSQFKIQYLE